MENIINDMSNNIIIKILIIALIFDIFLGSLIVVKEREDILRKGNNDKELRYISTIDNLTEKVYNKIENIDHKVDIIE